MTAAHPSFAPILERFLERYPPLTSLRPHLQQAFSLLARAVAAGGKLLVCGNGGSAADAEHIVGELIKSFAHRRPIPEDERELLRARYGEAGAKLGERLEGAIPALSLVSPLGLNTAIANDIGYDLVFAQQVYALGQPGDVLIALSTSGNSRNVVCAAQVARLRQVSVLGLTGARGGQLAELSDVCLAVPAELTHEIQEYHLPVYHLLCYGLEAARFGQHGLR